MMYYYLCSENKGADQLRGYCETDLRLCFRLCRLLVFSGGGSYSRKKTKSTQRHIRVSINYRHIPVHFNKDSAAHVSSLKCRAFIGSFTSKHTQRIPSRFSRKL